jgi:heat-inducible transcriptional repressor
LKTLINSRISKKDREKAVLLGLVELFIKTNTPVGSNALKNSGFDYISSATIRNYFKKWEKAGYLKQQHSSGGRIPTSLAYREYANYYLDKASISQKEKAFLSEKLKKETKALIEYLYRATDDLSDLTKYSCFLLMPHFDQDFIQTVHLIGLENKQILFILITDFGLIQTEIIPSPKKLNKEQISQIEDFFLWKLSKKEKPILKDQSIAKLAQYFYNEVVVRHIVHSTQNSTEDIYKTGLSKLLSYPEFNDPTNLAASLSIFENPNELKSFLYESMKINRLTSWIGNELTAFSSQAFEATIITIPYYINHVSVGAIAILGPIRLNYRKLFGILQTFSDYISENLTKNIYKFKLSYYQKDSFQKGKYVSFNDFILLEDKSKEN